MTRRAGLQVMQGVAVVELDGTDALDARVAAAVLGISHAAPDYLTGTVPAGDFTLSEAL